MKVTWLDRKSVAQESNEFEMALFKKNNDNTFTGITIPVMCKDFFQDVWYILHNPDKRFIIYSFSSPSDEVMKEELTKPVLYVGIRFTDKNKLFSKEQPIYSQKFVNHYEHVLGIQPGTVILSDDNTTLIFFHSREWTKFLYFISLYYLLVRTSCYADKNYELLFDKNTINIKDYKNSSMWISAIDKIPLLVENKQPSNIVKYEDKSLGTLTIHHRSGIISMKF